jgi:hypothetical protein
MEARFLATGRSSDDSVFYEDDSPDTRPNNKAKFKKLLLGSTYKRTTVSEISATSANFPLTEVSSSTSNTKF